jgi:hypothetical protein
MNKKRAGGMAQGVDPEFKPQYYKKKVQYQALNFNCDSSDLTIPVILTMKRVLREWDSSISEVILCLA